MSRSPPGTLYSAELLALAVELADCPFDQAAPLTGTARSRTCGSSVTLSGRADRAGTLQDVGLRVSACAVGQAAAAIFVAGAAGRTASAIEAARRQTARWLAGSGPRPDWPGIEALEVALPHVGRHQAILLPWNAAIDALSKVKAAD